MTHKTNQYYKERLEAAVEVHAKLTHQIAELREELEDMTAVKDIHQRKRREHFSELRKLQDGKHNV